MDLICQRRYESDLLKLGRNTSLRATVTVEGYYGVVKEFSEASVEVSLFRDHSVCIHIYGLLKGDSSTSEHFVWVDEVICGFVGSGEMKLVFLRKDEKDQVTSGRICILASSRQLDHLQAVIIENSEELIAYGEDDVQSVDLNDSRYHTFIVPQCPAFFMKQKLKLADIQLIAQLSEGSTGSLLHMIHDSITCRTNVPFLPRIFPLNLHTNRNLNAMKGELTEEMALTFFGGALGKIVGGDNQYGGADLYSKGLFSAREYHQVKCYSDENNLVKALTETRQSGGKQRWLKYETDLSGNPLKKARGTHELDVSGNERVPMSIIVTKDVDVESLKRKLKKKLDPSQWGLVDEMKVKKLPFSEAFFQKACRPFTKEAILFDFLVSLRPSMGMFLKRCVIGGTSLGVEFGLKVIWGILRGSSLRDLVRESVQMIPKAIFQVLIPSLIATGVEIGVKVAAGQVVRALPLKAIRKVFSKICSSKDLVKLGKTLSIIGVFLVPVEILLSNGFSMCLGWTWSMGRTAIQFLQGKLTKRELFRDGIVITSESVINCLCQSVCEIGGWGIGALIGGVSVGLLTGGLGVLPGVMLGGEFGRCFGSLGGGFVSSILKSLMRWLVTEILKVPNYDELYGPIIKDTFLRVVYCEFGRVLREEIKENLIIFYRKVYQSMLVKTKRRYEGVESDYVLIKNDLRKQIQEEVSTVLLALVLEDFAMNYDGIVIPDEEDVLQEVQHVFREEFNSFVRENRIHDEIGELRTIEYSAQEEEEEDGEEEEQREEQILDLVDAGIQRLRKESEGCARMLFPKNVELFALVCGEYFMIYRIHPGWGGCVKEQVIGPIRLLSKAKQVKVVKVDLRDGLIAFFLTDETSFMMGYMYDVEEDKVRPCLIEHGNFGIIKPTVSNECRLGEKYREILIHNFTEERVQVVDCLTNSCLLVLDLRQSEHLKLSCWIDGNGNYSVLSFEEGGRSLRYIRYEKGDDANYKQLLNRRIERSIFYYTNVSDLSVSQTGTFFASLNQGNTRNVSQCRNVLLGLDAADGAWTPINVGASKLQVLCCVRDSVVVHEKGREVRMYKRDGEEWEEEPEWSVSCRFGMVTHSHSNGFLYLGDDQGCIRQMDVKTGRIVWEREKSDWKFNSRTNLKLCGAGSFLLLQDFSTKKFSVLDCKRHGEVCEEQMVLGTNGVRLWKRIFF